MTYYRTERDVAIETKNGLLTCSSKDWLIGKHLYVRRDYEFDFIKASIELLTREGLLNEKNNNTVVDIGANIGMIAIACLRENYFQRAVAFEPSPDNFRLLKKNVGQNDLASRADCFQNALSSENKTLELELARGNSGDSRVRLKNGGERMNEHKRCTVSVEAVTFDWFLSQNKQFDESAIDLLWMDIQGHEAHFFQGARQFLKRRKIPCVCEFWSYGIERAQMSADEYCRIVGEVFTNFYQHTETGFELKPISEISGLFEKYKNPRQGTNIILI